jgi:putative ABC transport system permease protein
MRVHMYWSYATRSLLRGGQRSLLAIFCVAVGVMAIVALQLVGNAINAGLTSNIRAINGGDLSVSSPTTSLTASQLSIFASLQSQGAITSYTAVDAIGGVVHVSSATRQFQIEAVDPARFPIEGAPVFTTPASGSLAALLQGETVVITTPLAQTLDVSVGDTTHVYTQDGRSVDVTIGGVIESAGQFKGAMLLINLAAYAALPSAGSQPITYDAVYADVPGHTDANAASAEKLVQQQLPLATVQTTAQALSQNSTQVQQVRYFLQIVGLLALLIGGVGIVNTMQVLLRRRRIEIAMLKTAGYRRRDLFALFGLEAGLIGLVGGAVGTAAGVGVSFVVKQLTENSLQIVLPTVIDARTIGAGVAVGFVTALIFGLLPIARGSQVRPQAVLRELPERAEWKGRILTGALLALVVVLFFVLALSILQNVAVTVFTVAGTGIFLLLLGGFLGGVVFVLSRLPVAPLPRTWKANVKLALRNIGRQKVRTVATLAALYIGVFAVGLVVVFGQNITNSLNSFLASGNGINAEIVSDAADARRGERPANWPVHSDGDRGRHVHGEQCHKRAGRRAGVRCRAWRGA